MRTYAYMRVINDILQITRVNLPHPFAGKARLAYVEFGDEEAMKAGLEKHAEVRHIDQSSFLHTDALPPQKLNDIIPDVKQATDRETRGESPFRGFGGRGRGRGGPGGGYAARGLSAAGLTRGGPRGGGPGGGPGGGNANGGHTEAS